MNQESLDALLAGLKETGTLLVDGSNVSVVPATRAKVWKVPITETARRAFGEAMFANMVMLGVLTRISGVVSESSMEQAIRATVPPKSCATNVDAYRKGLKLEAS
jgi:2-oxoglutarate ferredoxin oxidoreductase subunit gamma